MRSLLFCYQKVNIYFKFNKFSSLLIASVQGRVLLLQSRFGLPGPTHPWWHIATARRTTPRGIIFFMCFELLLCIFAFCLKSMSVYCVNVLNYQPHRCGCRPLGDFLLFRHNEFSRVLYQQASSCPIWRLDCPWTKLARWILLPLEICCSIWTHCQGLIPFGSHQFGPFGRCTITANGMRDDAMTNGFGAP